MSVPTKVLVGDTRKATWVSSGISASPITHSVINGDETLVSSVSATSSGSGLYYALFKVDTPGYYVSQWDATVNGEPYKNRTRFKAVVVEVD